MNECKENGCRYLQTSCVTCGQLVIEKTLPAISEWISVKDRLPEPYVFVLVCEKFESQPAPISIARWEGDEWNGLGEDCDESNAFYSDIFWGIEWKEITHWMPLPEPPK